MKDSNLLYETSKKYRDLLSKLHDSVEEEVDYERDNNHVAAVNSGLISWGYIKQLIKFLEADSISDLVYETGYDLPYWATNLQHNLHNASIKDPSLIQKKFEFCKEYVETHKNYTDKTLRNLGNIRHALADCYVNTGDLATCDNLYTQWLKKEPDWGWGWIGWSDAYWLFNGNNEPDLIKAQHILEQGLAIKHVKDQKYILERLKDLKKQKACPKLYVVK